MEHSESIDFGSRSDHSLDITSNSQDQQHVVQIIKACDVCRKKKIKCEPLGIGQPCAQCVKSNSSCHFTPIRMKRAPKRSFKDKRFQELEQKLKSMESQLRKAVASNNTERVNLESESTHNRPNASLDEAFPEQSPVYQSHEPVMVSPTASTNSAQQLNIATPIHRSDEPPQLPLPQGIMPSETGLKEIPQGDDLQSLVENSFQAFHPAFPLFDPDIFMSNLDSLGTSPERSDWWACLNVVLAMKMHFRDTNDPDDTGEREAWGYFHNAFSVANQLMTMRLTLLSVQALLGMAIILLGTFTQGPVSLFVSAAIKLAQKMHLHRQNEYHGLNEAEIEERKCVFWIAYALDKELSLQMGQPPAQDDDDMDVESLSSSGTDSLFTVGGSSSDYFSFRAKLALIQGQMYKRLCTVKAAKQSQAERSTTVKELEQMLLSWRASVPAKYIRDYEGQPLHARSWGASDHPIILQLLYFNSLAIVYKSSPSSPFRDLREPGVAMEAQHVADSFCFPVEARKAVKLLQVTPRKRGACMWAVLHIYFKAASTLLNHVIDNPSSSLATVDIGLTEPLIEILADLSRCNNISRVMETYISLLDLYRAAKTAAATANTASTSWDQGLIRDSVDPYEGMEEGLEDDLDWAQFNTIAMEHDLMPAQSSGMKYS